MEVLNLVHTTAVVLNLVVLEYGTSRSDPRPFKILGPMTAVDLRRILLRFYAAATSVAWLVLNLVLYWRSVLCARKRLI
jgi:hypothetical protein